ncbi:putative fungal specific transcription [Diaporthe ampelina]|uniref:Putative fungal specific transcription n=1 Tax=Diaporthe ampelina TaxID=1214573 RepID=A0A0G2HDP2_9PEZI|nr:putative fungal specific transcription [Diaporthe ampelina]
MGISSIATTSPPVSALETGDAGTTAIVLSPRSLEASLNVLSRIPTQEVALSLFAKHTNPNDGWVRLAAKRVIESLVSVFGRTLRSRKPRDLEEMARLLSSNTARQLTEDEPDSDAWLSSFSGRNMRWESLGILFTYWALGELADQPHRPELRKSDKNPAQLTLVYREAAQICIELCKGCAPNSLLLYLTYKVAILESMNAGDAAPSFWRLHGENIALLTYLGLHALQDEKPYVPTASKEVKRRLVSQLFVIDKVAASFSGRPPLLSRKYMLTPLPLDICDEVLMSDPEAIANAVEALDEDGWNREGKCYSTTIVRARSKLARVMDEVMEVALGSSAYTSIDALL